MPLPTTDLILFFVASMPGIGRAHLVRLLYWSDLEARRFLGRPLSSLDYIWYTFGPFDSSVLSELDRLCQRGSLRIEQVRSPHGQPSWQYFSTGTAVPPAWGDDEKLILDAAVANFGRMNPSAALEEVVGQSEPMQAALESGMAGCRLRMELVDDQLRNLGIDPQRVIGAVKHLDAGQGVSHRELFERLRSPTVGSFE